MTEVTHGFTARFGGEVSDTSDDRLGDAAHSDADKSHAESLLRESLLRDALKLYPHCLPAYFALYKFHFYSHSLRDAERAVLSALEMAAQYPGITADWRRQSPLVIHDDILDTVERTPVVRVNRLAPSTVNMFVKCELFNPLSSVKDRPAARARHHRGYRTPRHVKAGTNRCRGTVRQHWYRTGHGMRDQGLSICRSDSGNLFGRTPQDHEGPGRKSDSRRVAKRGTGMVRKAKELAREHGWFATHQLEWSGSDDGFFGIPL